MFRQRKQMEDQIKSTKLKLIDLAKKTRVDGINL